MLGRAVLLLGILWTTTAHAFFPWFPPWVCAEDDALCKSQHATADARRSLGLAGRAVAGGGVALPIRQRAPSGGGGGHHGPLQDRVRHAARRLSHKYAQRTTRPQARPQARQPEQPEPRAPTPTPLAKRTNAFSVVTAATPTATNAVGIDQDGTDFSYFVEAAFGASGTPLLLLLDTGAGTTWVMGTDCASAACGLHSAFGAADSATLQTSADGFSIAYGSGAVAGVLARDTVRVASLAVTLSFGLANTTSDDFAHFPFDGILGLSRSDAVTDNFLGTVQRDAALPANVFGVSLWRAADGGPNTGEIVFGGVDADQLAGSGSDLAYTSVAASAGGDWAIPLDGVGYEGNGSVVAAGRLAYIDTGTTYVFGPAADVAALHAQIPGAASSDGGLTYAVPCSSNRPLTVVFSGVAYAVAPDDWLSAPDADGACTSNIYGHAVVADAWLLGDLFIKNVYAVFDVDESRIGFASKPNKTASTTAAATAATPAASADALPGLSGHETSATAASAATATAPASSTATAGGAAAAAASPSTATSSASSSSSFPAGPRQGPLAALVCLVAAAVAVAV